MVQFKKQNNFAHSSYSLFLISICLISFYTIYGWGPFTDLDLKVKAREAALARSQLIKQREVQVDWAEGGPEHQFWMNDSKCEQFVTKFSKVETLPARALASYPGSGNTWIRYLVEGSSGLYTGSVFNDRSILRAGHYGEGRNYLDGSTILQKTHHRSIYVDKYKAYGLSWRKEQIESFGGRAVIVVRNPYKAILSYWNFYNTKSHTSLIDKNSFKTLKFQDFVFTGASRWFEVIEDWITFGKEVYFIFYEDLQEDPVGEMRSLLDYLGLPVDEERLACISSHLAGSFHRTSHQEIDPFTQDHHLLLQTVIEKAVRLIEQYSGQILPIRK